MRETNRPATLVRQLRNAHVTRSIDVNRGENLNSGCRDAAQMNKRYPIFNKVASRRTDFDRITPR